MLVCRRSGTEEILYSAVIPIGIVHYNLQYMSEANRSGRAEAGLHYWASISFTEFHTFCRISQGC